MEDSQGAFLNMVMDRLHVLEDDNQALQKEVQEHKQALRLTPHVVPNTLYRFFSDGSEIFWELGETPMIDNKSGLNRKPLLEEHEKATMFYGRQDFWMYGALRIWIGTACRRTTFGEFYRVVNDKLVRRPSVIMYDGLIGTEENGFRMNLYEGILKIPNDVAFEEHTFYT